MGFSVDLECCCGIVSQLTFFFVCFDFGSQFSFYCLLFERSSTFFRFVKVLVAQQNHVFRCIDCLGHGRVCVYVKIRMRLKHCKHLLCVLQLHDRFGEFHVLHVRRLLRPGELFVGQVELLIDEENSCLHLSDLLPHQRSQSRLASEPVDVIFQSRYR